MTTVAEQFHAQRRRLIEAYIAPTRVTFSREGYRKAMKEQLATSAFMPAQSPSKPATYMGLPYAIDPALHGDVEVGSTCHTPPIPKVGKLGLSIGFNPVTGEVLVDGKAYGDPVNILELIGKSLSAAQLSDIIMHWLGNDSNWGDFEKALHNAVEQHGSFE